MDRQMHYPHRLTCERKMRLQCSLVGKRPGAVPWHAAMMRLETKEDFERARERLRRRDSESLVAFLMSLVGDSGPVGQQIRTFIIADDVAATTEAVRQRISRLSIPSEYEHRHSRGREMAATLEFIVDAIERLVLPRDPKAAFELLVAMFEADKLAMENCGEHDWEVACAYKRAAAVMAEAAKILTRAEVEVCVRALIDGDGYGMRASLASVLPEEHGTGPGGLA